MMTRQHRTLFLITIAVTVMIALLLAAGSTTWSVRDFTYSGNRGELQLKKTPRFIEAPRGALLQARLNAVRRALSVPVIHVFPDDCLKQVTVNGSTVFEVREGTCAEGHIPVVVPSAPELQLEAAVSNDGGGPAAAIIYTPNKEALLHPLLLALFVAFVAALAALLLNLGISRPATLIFAGACGLRFFYLTRTEFFDRTYDLLEPGGHLDYIRYMTRHFFPPNPNSGWEYDHPPLYYTLAARVLEISGLESLTTGYLPLQLFSLFLSIGFLVFAALLIARTVQNKTFSALALALVAFFPSAVIHSTRIGNDALLFFFAAATLYCLYLWIEAQSRFALWAAVGLSCLSILTKANGLVAASLIPVSMLMVWKRPEVIKANFRTVLGAGLALLFAVLLAFADNVLAAREGYDWLTGGLGISPSLFVGNSLGNYIWFDLPAYLETPFINTSSDAGGRQFFWNFFLKTALFAEFAFHRPFQWQLGAMISSLLLLLVLFFIRALSAFRSDTFTSVLACALLLTIVSVIFLRLHVPLCSNGDFRYAFPALLPLAILFGRKLSLDFAARKRRLVLLQIASVALFSVMSAAFFLLV